MKRFPFFLILAFFWGVVWALFLQFNHLGQFLSRRRTWLTVVVGIGIDLIIMLPMLPHQMWEQVVAVVACSSVGIITRSLYNEFIAKITEITDVENQSS